MASSPFLGLDAGLDADSSIPRIRICHLATTPIVKNNRIKIKWEEGNIQAYQSLVCPSLARVRETWADYNSPATVSILLKTTNDILSTCAAATNRVVILGDRSLCWPCSEQAS